MAGNNGSKTGDNTVEVDFEPAAGLEASTGGASAINFDSDAEATATKRSPTQAIKDEAGKYAQQATDRVRTFADDGKLRATNAIDEFAKMMQDAAGSVDQRLGEQYGQYARSAADQLTGMADSLRGKQVDELVDDAREFVRKSPAIALGTAAAVGFVLARLIKSGVDAAADYADRDDTPSTKA